ncbi:MAG: AAA family ATPase, partial [Pseudomonadota bacterium]
MKKRGKHTVPDFDEKLALYWQQYGLKQDPFAALIDTNMYINLQKLEQSQEILIHHLHNHNTLIAIVGRDGLGKSSFVYHAIESMANSLRHIELDANSELAATKLIQTVQARWQLTTEATQTQDHVIEEIVHQLQFRDELSLLIIDDAQLLPIETLNTVIELLQKQSEHQHKFHVILLGNEHLQTKLKLAEHAMSGTLDSHIIALTPLDYEETKQYITARLDKTNLADKKIFNESAFKTIFKQSQGIPDKINRLSQQFLIN